MEKKSIQSDHCDEMMEKNLNEANQNREEDNSYLDDDLERCANLGYN